MSIGVTERPLAFEAPSSHTAANVKKWWSSLKVKNMEGLQSVQSRADTILAGLKASRNVLVFETGHVLWACQYQWQ